MKLRNLKEIWKQRIIRLKSEWKNIVRMQDKVKEKKEEMEKRASKIAKKEDFNGYMVFVSDPYYVHADMKEEDFDFILLKLPKNIRQKIEEVGIDNVEIRSELNNSVELVEDYETFCFKPIGLNKHSPTGFMAFVKDN